MESRQSKLITDIKEGQSEVKDLITEIRKEIDKEASQYEFKQNDIGNRTSLARSVSKYLVSIYMKQGIDIRDHIDVVAGQQRNDSIAEVMLVAKTAFGQGVVDSMIKGEIINECNVF